MKDNSSEISGPAARVLHYSTYIFERETLLDCTFSREMLSAGRLMRGRRVGGALWGLQSTRGINKKLFFRGLPDSVTEETLQECLGAYGHIVAVSMQRSPHLRSCSALVTFRDLSSAFSVIDELQNSLLFGRRISVDFALMANGKAGYSPSAGNAKPYNTIASSEAAKTEKPTRGREGGQEAHRGEDVAAPR